jgi:hypothetical protein
MGERVPGNGPCRSTAELVMDDDEDDPGDVCAACGCSVCRLAEAFDAFARRPARASGPTAALPGPRLARYPLPSS